MKKAFLFFTSMFVFILMLSYLVPQSVNAQRPGLGDLDIIIRPDCRMLVEDCPGWNTGTRRVCTILGNENLCRCGLSTLCIGVG